MHGDSREMITTAERRFPVRIKLAVPPCGFGQRLPRMHGWLDENCGSDGWAITPSGLRGGAQRGGVDLFRGRRSCRRLCRPLVCREQG